MIPTLAAALLLALPGSGPSGLPVPHPTSAAVGPERTRADTVEGASLLRGSRLHLVVAVETPSATAGTLQPMERRDGTWRRAGPPVPVVVGKAGVGPKREGDGRAPRGIFSLGPAFGYAPDAPPAVEWPYRALSPGTVCVDDPASTHYNRIVEDGAVDSVDWSSAEAMRRDRVHGDDLYELGVEVAYNPEGRAGAGSCIFLHVWRGPESPTAGCTAMPEERLMAILARLDRGDRPVLVQGSRAWLEGLRSAGLLPYPVPETPAEP